MQFFCFAGGAGVKVEVKNKEVICFFGLLKKAFISGKSGAVSERNTKNSFGSYQLKNSLLCVDNQILDESVN